MAKRSLYIVRRVGFATEPRGTHQLGGPGQFTIVIVMDHWDLGSWEEVYYHSGDTTAYSG